MDPAFRDQFNIGHATERYSSIMRLLPKVRTGGVDCGRGMGKAGWRVGWVRQGGVLRLVDEWSEDFLTY